MWKFMMFGDLYCTLLDRANVENKCKMKINVVLVGPRQRSRGCLGSDEQAMQTYRPYESVNFQVFISLNSNT